MIKRLIRWFIATSLLGVLIPLLFFCIIDWFLTGKLDFYNTFLDFFCSGFFTLSAAALIFSLFEEYPNFKTAGIGFASGVWFTILVIGTSFFFYLDYKSDFQFIKNHILQFSIIWFMSAISATYTKYRIISYQKFS